MNGKPAVSVENINACRRHADVNEEPDHFTIETMRDAGADRSKGARPCGTLD
jgi:hypothetical protein